MIRERLHQWADYFGAVALALWVAAAILYFLGNQPNERLVALAVAGAVFGAVYLALRFTLVRSALASRTARYGSNALVLAIAFIGIVGLLNFLGARYHYRYDSTANQQFTLSQKTIQVLQGLKEPVQAIAFYTLQTDQAMRNEIEGRLREYSQINSQFSYRFVDPQAEPQIAEEYKVLYDQTVVFERGKRRENAFATDEQSLTNAVFKVSQDTQPTLYFTTGHGEHSPVDTGDNGYSVLKDPLEQENYKVDVVDLKTLTDTLPSDISLLVIAGPRTPFDPQEVTRIKDYFNAGGRLFILLDPNTQTGLDGFLKDVGITARNDVIHDPKSGFFGQAQVPVINSYRTHPVTQDLAGQSSFFPYARSLVGDATSITYTVTSLFATSDLSWGETDFDSVKNQNAKFDEGKDAKGPLDFAYTIEGRGEKPARLVIIGNSTFITNGTFRTRVMSSSGQAVPIQSGNGLIFANTLHWLAGQENLIAIDAKAQDSRTLFLTTEQTNLIMLSTIGLLPALILLFGGVIWWRRR